MWYEPRAIGSILVVQMTILVVLPKTKQNTLHNFIFSTFENDDVSQDTGLPTYAYITYV